MSNRKAILISNPKTGRYDSRRSTPQEISNYLRNCGIDVELILTSGPGDASKIASRVANNGQADVIVAGGDGTINEAIQGIAGSNVRLAIIPRGTGNVLARELGLPFDPQQAAAVVARGRSRKIHFGAAIDPRQNTTRYFVLMAGVGLDASVVTGVQPSLKKRFGKAAFVLSGLSHLADWRPHTFTLEVNGKRYNATFAGIGNAASYGGALAITPGARIDQPEFEICIIETASRLRYLRLLSKVMGRGLAESEEGVQILHATKVEAFGTAPVQVDGEVIGELPMSFEIAPFSLEVIVP
jgi:diacylglycerol kinase (ATP)